MEIAVRTERGVTVVALAGELTWKTVPEVQAGVLEAAPEGGKVALDMTGVPYLSSAGLRLLLTVYRTLTGRGGRLVLVGLSPELADTMALTGFLDVLPHQQTLEAALADLG